MICPTHYMKSKSAILPRVKEKFPRAARILSKSTALPEAKTIDPGMVWSPMTAGPFMVPVTRWIE